MFYWAPRFAATMFVFTSSSLLLKGTTLMFSPSFGENRDFRCATQPGRSHRSSSDLGRAVWVVWLLKSFSQQCNITFPSLSVIPVSSVD